jgi:hypothetical protein
LSKIIVEARWFPLVLQCWPATVNDLDLDEFFKSIDELARRAQRQHVHYAVVVWGGATDLDMGQRRRIARWVRGSPRELRERNAGSFLMVSSAMQRGAVNALRWLLPELRDVYAFSTTDAAVDAALAALKTKNALAPANVDEIRRSIHPPPL